MNKPELLQLRIVIFLSWVGMFFLILGLEIGRYVFSGKFGEVVIGESIMILFTLATVLPFCAGMHDEDILKHLKWEPVKK